MSSEAEVPPFATSTLARLYLAQGHVELASAVAAASGSERDPDVAFQQGLDRREAVLRSLLAAVQQRRRR